MKIDDKIISYELTGNIRKLSPGDTERVEQEKLHPEKQVQEQKQPEGDAIVHLSQASKEAQAVKELIGSLPDARDDVVASMRGKIETGTYEVKYEAVADKMVDAFLNDLA
jgi:negative regulator of flagellin synthesis FlgM